ncbi:hypothetical protein BRAS3843_1330041 [Bradyrhizobium sp. STM 3843]|nr:hypothetical protein BRAS3843_1330041 [Bradyrhizobium sp. STM 3843]
MQASLNSVRRGRRSMPQAEADARPVIRQAGANRPNRRSLQSSENDIVSHRRFFLGSSTSSSLVKIHPIIAFWSVLMHIIVHMSQRIYG